MSSSIAQKYSIATLDDIVKKVSEIVAKESGNILGNKQQHMVNTRIKKRMLELKCTSPSDYIHYLNENKKEEVQELVSLLTTHHTFFFREFIHFEKLRDKLPDFCKVAKNRKEKTIRIWSAACSKGQEVYSLAMFLQFYLPKVDPTMNYEILGTDIDRNSVKMAQNGVYNKNEIKEAPMNFISNNWSRGTGDISQFIKAKPSIKNMCRFDVMNLMNINKSTFTKKFDVIFCRNVFIYFELEDVKKIVLSMLDHLNPGGILITGVSESLASLNLDLISIGPSVYKKKEDELYKTPVMKGISDKVPTASARTHPSTPLSAEFVLPRPLKVVSVDDSSSILTLMKKIFSMDKEFELVGTAQNGLEAQELLKSNDAHVMTLDIHMPEMDGIQYLEKNFNYKHPPVVIVSSANRDESEHAFKTLSLGASDFVEKPALNNLMQRAEEIKNKLKMAYLDKHQKTNISSFDKEFKKNHRITDLENKQRIVVASLSDQKKLTDFFKSLEGQQPPTFLLFEGQSELLEAFIKNNKYNIKNLQYIEEIPEKIESNNIYLGDLQNLLPKLKQSQSSKKTSFQVFGKCSTRSESLILNWSQCQLLVEDLGIINKDLKEAATDIFPWTSFAFVSTSYFSKEGGK